MYITGHGDVQVPVNLETARLLHQCVRNGLEDDRQALYKQLKDGKYFISVYCTWFTLFRCECTVISI